MINYTFVWLISGLAVAIILRSVDSRPVKGGMTAGLLTGVVGAVFFGFIARYLLTFGIFTSFLASVFGALAALFIQRQQLSTDKSEKNDKKTEVKKGLWQGIAKKLKNRFGELKEEVGNIPSKAKSQVQMASNKDRGEPVSQDESGENQAKPEQKNNKVKGEMKKDKRNKQEDEKQEKKEFVVPKESTIIFPEGQAVQTKTDTKLKSK